MNGMILSIETLAGGVILRTVICAVPLLGAISRGTMLQHQDTGVYEAGITTSWVQDL